MPSIQRLSISRSQMVRWGKPVAVQHFGDAVSNVIRIDPLKRFLPISSPRYVCCSRLFHSSTTEKITGSMQKHATAAKVTEEMVTVQFQDGPTTLTDSKHDMAVFHAVWLWRNDSSGIHPSSGQHVRPLAGRNGYALLQRIEHADIVVDEKRKPPPPGCFHPVGTVYSLEHDEPKKTLGEQQQQSKQWLRIFWKDNLKQPSYFHVDWLYRCRYSETARTQHRRETVIEPQHAIRSDTQLEVYQYQAVLDSNDTQYQLLTTLIQHGAVIVNNTPNTATAVKILTQRLAGMTSHSFLYGETFEVRSVPDSHNIAYTSERLAPHQDLAYYESPPGLQLLHCRSQNVVSGGESQLIDVMAAAAEFRRICPIFFQYLTQFEATFLKQRPAADLFYCRPHIRLDSMGDVVSVHWSPPFEGPLCLVEERHVRDYYRARCALELLLDKNVCLEPGPISSSSASPSPPLNAVEIQALQEYAHRYTWERSLEPGQVLVFNNQRMLHGRNSFILGTDGERHLTGCYANIDDFLNQYRIRRREQPDLVFSGIRRVGNGSSSAW